MDDVKNKLAFLAPHIRPRDEFSTFMEAHNLGYWKGDLELRAEFERIKRALTKRRRFFLTAFLIASSILGAFGTGLFFAASLELARENQVLWKSLHNCEGKR